jgi:hypothetical protein
MSRGIVRQAFATCRPPYDRDVSRCRFETLCQGKGLTIPHRKVYGFDPCRSHHLEIIHKKKISLPQAEIPIFQQGAQQGARNPYLVVSSRRRMVLAWHSNADTATASLGIVMKKYLSAAVGLAMACAIPTAPAFANTNIYGGFINGNELYGWCTASDERTALCVAYVDDVADVMGDSCLRAGVSEKQVVDVVTNSLRDHPEERDKLAATLSIAAITKAFCPG